MEGSAPVYVRVTEFDDVLSTLGTVKKKLKESQDLLHKLSELKAQEDKEVAAWAETLDDVADRVSQFEKNLTQ